MVDIWSIFGRYLVNFVVVDIYCNPTGRSGGDSGDSSESVDSGDRAMIAKKNCTCAYIEIHLFQIELLSL